MASLEKVLRYKNAKLQVRELYEDMENGGLLLMDLDGELIENFYDMDTNEMLFKALDVVIRDAWIASMIKIEEDYQMFIDELFLDCMEENYYEDFGLPFMYEAIKHNFEDLQF